MSIGALKMSKIFLGISKATCMHRAVHVSVVIHTSTKDLRRLQALTSG